MLSKASKPYWLHLCRHAALGMGTTYTIGRTDAPSEGISGGACPTVHYHSWEMLWSALQYVRISDALIEQIGKDLKEKQTYILEDVLLTYSQLIALGFPDNF